MGFLDCVSAWLTVVLFMLAGVSFAAGVLAGDSVPVVFGVACVVIAWVLEWLDDMDV